MEGHWVELIQTECRKATNFLIAACFLSFTNYHELWTDSFMYVWLFDIVAQPFFSENQLYWYFELWIVLFSQYITIISSLRNQFFKNSTMELYEDLWRDLYLFYFNKIYEEIYILLFFIAAIVRLFIYFISTRFIYLFQIRFSLFF